MRHRFTASQFACIAVVLCSAVAVADPVKQVYRADGQWRPIEYRPATVVPGSALDFATFLDAPAGKHGFVVIRDGQLVFEETPDRPIRIYGCVVSHALPFIDKAQSDRLADALAATGYSGVRLHNYNFAKGVMKEVGSAEFSQEGLDQFDYFLAGLKKRGIYYSFPINAWGFFKGGDAADVGEFRDRPFRFESNGLLPISAKLQGWFKAYATHLLTHVNPYTGLALKDDPGLMSIELANEDSLLSVLGQYPELIPIYRERCRAAMKAKGGNEPAAEEVERALPRFVMDAQDRYVTGMTAFLRELGLRQPITDLNFRDNMAYAIPRSRLDYVDQHHYYSLYKALPNQKPSADPPYRQNWNNPNSLGWSYFLGPAAVRVFGKPFDSSEFNGCFASPYWVYTGPAEASLAALQGWNAVFRCGLAAHAERFFDAAPVRRIETSASPLMMLSERIGASILARGQLAAIPQKLPFVVTPEYLMAHADLAAGPKYPTVYSRLAWQYQIGTILLDGSERLDAYPVLVAPPDMKLPATLAGKTVLAADASLTARVAEVMPAKSTGFTIDTKAGSAQVVTPASETFLLPANVGEAVGDVVTVRGNGSVSVCSSISLNAEPLGKSKRLLVLYLTDLKNTGTEVEFEEKPKDSVIVRNAAGTLPHLVRQGKVVFEFKMQRAAPQVWALKYDGSRAAKIDVRATAEGFSFEAQAVAAADVFSAFEVAWEP